MRETKVEVYRAMLHTRSMAPLRLIHELVLVLRNRDSVGERGCDGEGSA